MFEAAAHWSRHPSLAFRRRSHNVYGSVWQHQRTQQGNFGCQPILYQTYQEHHHFRYFRKMLIVRVRFVFALRRESRKALQGSCSTYRTLFANAVCLTRRTLVCEQVLALPLDVSCKYRGEHGVKSENGKRLQRHKFREVKLTAEARTAKTLPVHSLSPVAFQRSQVCISLLRIQQNVDFGSFPLSPVLAKSCFENCARRWNRKISLVSTNLLVPRRQVKMFLRERRASNTPRLLSNLLLTSRQEQASVNSQR